tara:strand:+ start:9135 stop:10307 length:1173 start_codon:yes stop_codon:yes gene_type:complete
MEFVSSDRSQDAEFTRGLQNYNTQVFVNNQQLAAQIDKSKEDLQDTLDDNTQVAGLAQLKVQGAGGGAAAGALGKATAIPKAITEIKETRAAAKTAKVAATAAAKKLAKVGGFKEVAITAEEAAKLPSGAAALGSAVLGEDGQKISGALRAVTKFRPTAGLLRNADIGEDSFKTISEAYGGGAKGKAAAIGFKRAQRLGVEPTEKILQRGSVKEGAKVVGARVGAEAAEKGAERGAEKAAVKGGEIAVEKGVGKLLAKGAVGLARGAGIAGAALSAGTAIEGLVEGKKFKWNEQGAEIGGALLDVIGTGLEFTGFGAAAGLGLQVAGTALSTVGTVNEGLDIDPTKKAADTQATGEQAKIQSDLEQAQRGARQGLTAAAQGGAAVGRQIQ